MSGVTTVVKGTDPYNSADPTIDTIEWEAQPDALQPVIIFDDAYWQDVWGMVPSE